MARPSLVLYLDVVSPFAYLAFHVVTVSEPNSPYSDESYWQRLYVPVASVWLSISVTGSTIRMLGFPCPFCWSYYCMVAAVILMPMLPTVRVKLLFTKLIVVLPDIPNFRTVRCQICTCVLRRYHESVRQYGSYQYQKYVLGSILNFV